jgi:multidrug efflux pump subunit AcrA (membrane-fusion protein)
VPLESLRKAVAAANERLKQSTLTAPSDGVVLEVLGDEGDAVGQTPIIRLGNVAQMVALAEVYDATAATSFGALRRFDSSSAVASAQRRSSRRGSSRPSPADGCLRPQPGRW